MSIFKGTVVLLLIISTTCFARNRNAEKLRTQARAEEVAGHLDKALQLANQAHDLDPADPAYGLEVHRIRFEAGTMHIKAGYQARNAGQLEQAMVEFQAAHTVDPSSDLATQEIRRTTEMLHRIDTAPVVNEKTLTTAELSTKLSKERNQRLISLPLLKPISSDLIDLKMTNRPRILFETLCKLAGVNIVFDPDYETQQTVRSQQLDFNRTTLEDALNQLAVATKSYWKPLNSNTIFVTLDNPAKRRDYAEEMVRVFYLSNLTSPQEMQEILTVLRTVVDVQKVFSYASQSALIVRAEADTMALVEKIISDLDKPRAEVIVDVMVMEVSSTWTRALSAAVAGTGLNTSATFTPRTSIQTPTTTSTTSTSTTTTTSTASTSSTSTATSVPISSLGHLSSADYSVSTLPGATLEAVLSDSGTRILQQPQIRSVDNAKAVLKIGDKVPTASGSYSSAVSTATVSALVNTQFTYLDVGVNLEITPKVHDRNEVSMHIDLDVSQVKAEIDLGGINEPEISQNKITADVRLVEGEASIIGGIIQQTDSKGVTGIPGLASIPILGRLFSSENLEKDRTELVIALIPHIVRAPSIDSFDLRGIASGSATQIRVNYAPQTAPASTMAITAAPVPSAPPATAPVIRFAPRDVEATLGSDFTVVLSADTDQASTRIQFDPQLLQIKSIDPALTKKILNDAGQAEVSFAKAATIVFTAVGRGDTLVNASAGSSVNVKIR